MHEQISTRRLRVLKYRGSVHGTNEYPFLIGEQGISVLPITSLRLDHAAPTERVSTGVPRLDEMLGGRGVFRGSSVLVSGSPGTGKSSLGAAFAEAACRRGERGDAVRLRGIERAGRPQHGLHRSGPRAVAEKRPAADSRTSRPTLQGLEQHLLAFMTR